LARCARVVLPAFALAAPRIAALFLADAQRLVVLTAIPEGHAFIIALARRVLVKLPAFALATPRIAALFFAALGDVGAFLFKVFAAISIPSAEIIAIATTGRLVPAISSAGVLVSSSLLLFSALLWLAPAGLAHTVGGARADIIPAVVAAE
jgi:hypothetical protein